MRSDIPSPPRPIEFTVRPLPGRYHGAADHASVYCLNSLVNSPMPSIATVTVLT